MGKPLIKIYCETYKRYKQILKIKGKTIQQDIEDHINKVISK